MIHFGREVTGNLDALLRREWLVTNGIGGYAMSTLAGARTRRYHGLLTASLQPPTRRTMMVANLDTWVEIDGRRSPLVTHEWAAGVVLPDGYRHLESFRLEGSIPVFVWALGDVRIEQRVWMAHGHNTTYVTFTYERGSQSVRMTVKPLCTYRDHHTVTKGGYHVDVDSDDDLPWPDGDSATIQVVGMRGGAAARPFRVLVNRGIFEPDPEWWWSFHLSEEKKRGMPVSQEDLLAAGTVDAQVPLGETLAVVFTAESHDPLPWDAALAAEQARQAALLTSARLERAPDWIRHLALAADQFIVTRDIGGVPGQSVLAGYPWFSDWGRDTMIALPGLTVALNRLDDAAAILRTYANFVSEGMLPNRFPDAGQPPEYNTVDASLWYFVSLYALFKARPDHPVIGELYPTLVEMIDAHVAGTRFGIRQDPDDGLLFAGESGVQLTWMDAKIDDWVVTPRIGKPVEVNALWYNALRMVAELASMRGRAADAARFTQMADHIHLNFGARFWYSGGYLYDVIDGPSGDDPTLRPNQIFAVSLPFPLLSGEQAQRVVDSCARELLMSYGLRSLAPDETDYVGYYGGDPTQRDSSYHQGTAWSWLIGPFVSAHYRVYGDARRAYSYLEPLRDHLFDHGIGSISEIFDGDPPHAPRGTIAQAWSVAEALRAWRNLEPALAAADPPLNEE